MAPPKWSKTHSTTQHASKRRLSLKNTDGQSVECEKDRSIIGGRNHPTITIILNKVNRSMCKEVTQLIYPGSKMPT